jgi:hypothetical protein
MLGQHRPEYALADHAAIHRTRDGDASELAQRSIEPDAT